MMTPRVTASLLSPSAPVALLLAAAGMTAAMTGPRQQDQLSVPTVPVSGSVRVLEGEPAVSSAVTSPFLPGRTASS